MSNNFEENIKSLRQGKLQQILELDNNVITRVSVYREISSILEKYADATIEDLENANVPVVMRGRLLVNRLQGKSGFGKIQYEGQRIQFYIRKDSVGERDFAIYKLLDLGDHISVEGFLMRTNAGELTVRVLKLNFLQKAFLPMPDKIAGQTDAELSLRQRYVDLFTNNDVRKTFVIRSQVIKSIREYLSKLDFMEVETPMLQSQVGGAAAQPFVTHHNALDIDLSLRIAPELYLKRLVVGGFNRVFELNRNFRNEGIDTKHNPEFTMVEFYQAYADYFDMMETVKNLITVTARNVAQLNEGYDDYAILQYGGHRIDFEVWNEITMCQAIQNHWPIAAGAGPDIGSQHTDTHNTERTLGAMERLRIAGIINDYDATVPFGNLIVHMFETLVEPNLIQPTIIYDFPTSASPLARRMTASPSFAQRFEIYIAGMEIGNAFSELTDPFDQLARFEEQVANRVDGATVDHDYIRALEYGMPPTAGAGIGIDRLVMLLTNSQSIRDVVLFPTLRPQTNQG